jgi:hypothetical protein
MEPQVRPSAAATQFVVWASLAAAPVFCTLVAFLARPGTAWGASLPDLGAPLELALTVAALGSAALGLVVPRVMGARAGRGLAAGASEDESRRAAQVPCIVQWALFEAVAIHGFVIAMAGAPASRVVPFAALALALLLAHPPTRARVDAMLGR